MILLDWDHKKYKISYTHKAKCHTWNCPTFDKSGNFFFKGKNINAYSYATSRSHETHLNYRVRQFASGERYSDDYGNISMFKMCENYMRMISGS